MHYNHQSSGTPNTDAIQEFAAIKYDYLIIGQA